MRDGPGRHWAIVVAATVLWAGCDPSDPEIADPDPPTPPLGDTPPAVGWELLPGSPAAPQSGRHDDIVFLRPSLGWMVNISGNVYRTGDGGETWDLLHADEQVSFRSVGFADEELGWAGNLNAFSDPAPGVALFETRDGGVTWSNVTDRVTGPEPVGICGIWVADERRVYAVGRWNGPAIFVRTRDGGVSWQSRDMAPLATGLVDVHFFDVDRGLVIGGRGVGNPTVAMDTSRTVILSTDDGGDSWETVYESAVQGTWGWKFSFPTGRVGYAATQGPNQVGLVLKTIDGGRSWTELIVAPDLGFSGIGFVSADLGWLGADGDQVYETSDGGATWYLVRLGRNLNRFRVLGPGLAYASGERAYRYLALRSGLSVAARVDMADLAGPGASLTVPRPPTARRQGLPESTVGGQRIGPTARRPRPSPGAAPRLLRRRPRPTGRARDLSSGRRTTPCEASLAARTVSFKPRHTEGRVLGPDQEITPSRSGATGPIRVPTAAGCRTPRATRNEDGPAKGLTPSVGHRGLPGFDASTLVRQVGMDPS